ncbi:unnamed protein product [Acanthoscelides obtectus]|uniref:Uncharacterized protein n=1 Tax=Acanthoscelides obtectus TaxID=200917 RepID=A0A9P0LA35_ACAOB|nr:unnamed protein product [Acanthoscelides obtectus]CAK1664595.1 hypothetical protein AOBTE_LOCUS24353 [Acanthoscelides obtectus]
MDLRPRLLEAAEFVNNRGFAPCIAAEGKQFEHLL